MFFNVHDEFDPVWIEFAVKACLLFLLGCTLFVDKSFMRVSIVNLKFLENLWEVQDYAWGAATLAHLYRQL